MLKNYLLTAWKVFLRRKFFTFINLFGIVLTLTVIMVATTLVDSYLFPSGPEKTSGNYLAVTNLVLTNDKKDNTWSGGLGPRFIRDNIQTLKSPEKTSINSGVTSFAIYRDAQKFNHELRRTDAVFWEVLNFEFLQGRPFSHEEFEQGAFVAVISRALAETHFPDTMLNSLSKTGQSQTGQTEAGQSVIGQSLTVKSQRYQIIGVVENVPIVERLAYANMWVPYTTLDSSVTSNQLQGQWQAILYHSDASSLDAVQAEYRHLLQHNARIDNNNGMTTAFSGAFDKLELFSRELFARELEYTYDSAVGRVVTIASVLIVLFMLLPSMNMVNLNISRIMERSSEIGIRKAFGASSKQLVMQFIVESIALTLIGGIAAFALTAFLLGAIEASGIIPYAQLNLNLRLFVWGLFMILLFAVIAGAYPALKMSRLHPVTALKGGA